MLSDQNRLTAAREIWALAYRSGRTPEQALWEYERAAAETLRDRDTLPAPPEDNPPMWSEERPTLPAVGSKA